MAAQYEEPRVFQPGDTFRDHHRVISFMGAGASGQVYVIEHRFTRARFALKVAHRADWGDPWKEGRSLGEAQAAYRIQHRNVVRVIDLAREANGMVWQIMELLDGQTVAGLLRRYGKLSPLYAIDVAVEAAFGLQAAHEQGVLHRDVQPSNLFVTSAGEVKVLDFSLARMDAGVATTQGRPARGSVGYMSPEHGNDLATEQIDVYSLGVTLWQMLAGRQPFQGPEDSELTVATRQLRGLPSLVRAAGLPAYCDEVLRTATAMDPAERHAGMWALAQALRELRQRLERDPEAAGLVRITPAWERQLPVVRNPDGWTEYRPPRSLPRGSPAPGVPSRRILLSEPDGEERRSSGVVARAEPAEGAGPPPTVRWLPPEAGGGDGTASGPIPLGGRAAPERDGGSPVPSTPAGAHVRGPRRRILLAGAVAALLVGVLALALAQGVLRVSLETAEPLAPRASPPPSSALGPAAPLPGRSAGPVPALPRR